MTVFVVGAMIVGTTQAGAVADFSTYTFNTARGLEEKQRQPNHHRDVILFLSNHVHHGRPWTLSTQESRRGHMALLALYLGASGRPYFWNHGASRFLPHPDVPPSRDACRPHPHDDPHPDHPAHWGNYGNGILSIGGHLESLWQVLQPSDQVEFRNIVCVRMQNFGFQHWACSTHITNPERRGPGVTRDQAINANAIRVWHEAVSNARPLVGGDYNINYGGAGTLPPGLAEWHGTDVEAILPQHRPTAGTRMIDYQWADRPQMTQRSSPQCLSVPQLSDHRFCIGHFRVT
jgi:hypothetical protein